MTAALQALRSYDPTGPTCVIHGDAHLGNMYLTADGHPGFLDWQTVRRGHWAQDVAYFYISSLDPLDRRAWEKGLVSGYLAALDKHGAEGIPSEARAWEAIRAHICYGLFYWMVNLSNGRQRRIMRRSLRASAGRRSISRRRPSRRWYE